MNVKEVQRRLWEQSKIHKENREASLPLFPTNPYDNRVRNLSDLIHQPDWLNEAALRVYERSKGKAAGIDGVTVAKFMKQGPENLRELQTELKKGIYRPRPLRRVEIPKANATMRPLGIPCLRDKIVQEAIRMMLEPIFEVEFHENSYGFRPHRCARHAIMACQHSMNHGFTWVIEGDVKACFDEISHKAILGVVREKVMDNKFLDLLKLFLKAGVMIDGKVHPTVKGVPQGGVVSPLLANAVLNELDWFLHEQAEYGYAGIRARIRQEPNLRFVRYADDWCVFITRANRRYAESLKVKIGEFLKTRCGLELSPEKTKVTHVRDGFDFLGFHLVQRVGRSGKYVAKVKVGRKALAGIRARLNEEIRYQPAQESIDARIQKASAVIRGWSNYFKIAHDYSTVSNRLDHFTHWVTVKAISRKFDLSSRHVHIKFYHRGRLGVAPERTLVRFSDTKISLDRRKPMDYEPGLGLYLEDWTWEANNRYYEQQRPGQQGMKQEALQRDGHQCRSCGCLVVSETSQLDHIVPVQRFASFEQAHTLENVQILCLYCHKRKSGTEY